MIPREIEISHIRDAARQIDEQGVPFTRSSRVFDVVIHGRSYPPKYLLSVATKLARGEELSAWDFITTEARHFLTRLGFKVVEKRKRTLKIRMPIVVATPSFVVCWDDVECRDVIPLSWLRGGPPLIGVEHEMHDTFAHLKGRAKCDVTVKSRKACFDYRPYRNFNGDNRVEFGVTEVAFTLDGSFLVTSIEWRPEASPEDIAFGNVEEAVLQTLVRKPYVRPKTKSGKTAAYKRERPGQLKFRNDLKRVYGNRCCVSRCGVSEALEGAHIDSYRSPASDHPSNGLLLRRDIHALFDKHLLSVDPHTGRVVVAAILSGTEYEDLQGATPLPPANPWDAPDSAATSRHFAAFKKKNP